jgi:hypothetical protein
MTDRKFNILFVTFSYGGNGCLKSESPEVGRWLAKAKEELKADPRFDLVKDTDIAETPIPMSRNRAAKIALEKGFDFLVMIDSDMACDLYLDVDPEAKPFMKSSLDFLIDLYEEQLAMVFAPYCGPNPSDPHGGESNVYVFDWTSLCNDQSTPNVQLKPISRYQAARMKGIMEMGAGPTGLVVIDTRIFKKLPPAWFDYEYTDERHTEKASTEDVYFMRNASLIGCKCYCNWDAWAGHIKSSVVGKPLPMTVEMVREYLRDAVVRGIRQEDCIMELNPGKSVNRIARELDIPLTDIVPMGKNGDGR